MIPVPERFPGSRIKDLLAEMGVEWEHCLKVEIGLNDISATVYPTLTDSKGNPEAHVITYNGYQALNQITVTIPIEWSL